MHEDVPPKETILRKPTNTNAEKIMMVHQRQSSTFTVLTDENGSDHKDHKDHKEHTPRDKNALATSREYRYKISDMASQVWKRIRQPKTSIPTPPTLPPLKESSCRSYRSKEKSEHFDRFPTRQHSNASSSVDDHEPMSKKIQCKNMNSQLAELIGMRHYDNHARQSTELWQPPLTHGLDNGGQRIIPEYYLTTNMKDNLLTIDYHYMILDDIRNLRPLNAHQLTYIQDKLPEEDKQHIIVEFNQVVQHYLSQFMDEP